MISHPTRCGRGHTIPATGPARALIAHRNGTAWKRVKCPKHLDGYITSVAAAHNAWAVGSYDSDTGRPSWP
jgi:hypothetical protein